MVGYGVPLMPTSPSTTALLQSQLDRVELELRGELVEERLERERRGRRSGRAVRAEREAVRLDAVAADVVRLPAVRAGDQQRRDPLDAPAGIRAAVDDHARLDPGERPVGTRADLQMRDLGRCRVRRREVLGSREHEANGASQRERRARGERLDERELAAEGAAEWLGDHADPLERKVECSRELAARHERALRARRDDERAGRLEPGRADLRLEVRLVDPRRPERPLDDCRASRRTPRRRRRSRA